MKSESKQLIAFAAATWYDQTTVFASALNVNGKIDREREKEFETAESEITESDERFQFRMRNSEDFRG
jgi:head-tail adaptor